MGSRRCDRHGPSNHRRSSAAASCGHRGGSGPAARHRRLRHVVFLEQLVRRHAVLGRVPVLRFVVALVFPVFLLVIDLKRIGQPPEHEHRHAQPVAGQRPADLQFIRDIGIDFRSERSVFGRWRSRQRLVGTIRFAWRADSAGFAVGHPGWWRRRAVRPVGSIGSGRVHGHADTGGRCQRQRVGRISERRGRRFAERGAAWRGSELGRRRSRAAGRGR